MNDISWLGEARDGDVVALRVGRCGEELVAEWPHLGTLRVRHDGSDARFSPADGADAIEVEKLRRGAVRLLLRHLEGKLGLHAAAVAMDDSAVILVGASGDGKSTLAAALCRRGAALLSDDATALDRGGEGWMVLPFEETHWLDGASRESLSMVVEDSRAHGKARIAPARVADRSARARAIVVLSFADGAPLRLTRMSGIDAMAALVPMVMRFAIDDPDLQRRELDALSELVASVPVHRLERPRDLACLAVTCDLLASAVAR